VKNPKTLILSTFPGTIKTGEEGIEPPLTVLETAALPLYYSPVPAFIAEIDYSIPIFISQVFFLQNSFRITKDPVLSEDIDVYKEWAYNMEREVVLFARSVTAGGRASFCMA
jgi:hypothetical protein